MQPHPPRNYTLPETNIGLENGYLEDDPFLLGLGLFSGDTLVLGRVEGLRLLPVTSNQVKPVSKAGAHEGRNLPFVKASHHGMTSSFF